MATPGVPEALELGATLREMRLARKRDIDEIADELRIRSSYLQAIEEGRFADLPGSTYALGFVRAYADALGLDANDAARRFKAAMGAGSTQPNLILPSPVAEGRLPTGAVLLVAALLAILVYGGWYVLTTEGHDPGAVVASLPSRVVSVVRDALPERKTEPPAATVSLTPPPQSQTQPQRQSITRQEAAPGAPASDQSAVGTAATGTATESAASEDDDEDVDEEEDTAPLPPEQVQEAAASTHIVLVAHADAWVELRDAGGAQIYSRVLRKDERYEVPDRSGLLMMTGNAGGVEVLVNGRPAPPLGPMGAVKRNIVMDPDRLLAGTAVPAAPPLPTTPSSAATPTP